MAEILPGGAVVCYSVAFIEGCLVANRALIRACGEGIVGGGNFYRPLGHVLDIFPADGLGFFAVGATCRL